MERNSFTASKALLFLCRRGGVFIFPAVPNYLGNDSRRQQFSVRWSPPSSHYQIGFFSIDTRPRHPTLGLTRIRLTHHSRCGSVCNITCRLIRFHIYCSLSTVAGTSLFFFIFFCSIFSRNEKLHGKNTRHTCLCARFLRQKHFCVK